VSILHSDADALQIIDWAQGTIGLEASEVVVSHTPRPTPMIGTRATGAALVTNGSLGADLIRVPAGGGFSPHTHPGDHILIIVAGLGTITYAGRVHPTRAGQIYMIEGLVPHAVGAITDHVIIAVGSPHRPVDGADRMELVDYAAVVAPDGEFTCLICEKTVGAPDYLHDVDCSHCPCERCVNEEGPDRLSLSERL
jgi:quercetin dioxygenase-like cupin family protein